MKLSMTDASYYQSSLPVGDKTPPQGISMQMQVPADTFLAVDPTPPITSKATSSFRWRGVPYTNSKPRVLEQLWIDGTGGASWVPVPVVIEDDGKEPKPN